MVFQASNLAGVGVIARDNRGDPIGALTMPIPFRQSVTELEALACQRAVQFALEIGLNQVVIEGDSVTIIEALKNGSGQFASYGMSLMIFGHNLLGSNMLNFLILAVYATLLLMHWLKKLSLV